MTNLPCDWDPEKAEANEAKHGVAFEEACTAFRDPLARVSVSHNTTDEYRSILIGSSEQGGCCWSYLQTKA